MPIGLRAKVYDYMALKQLLKMTLLSKSERAFILTKTHEHGLIRPKPLSFRLSDVTESR